MAVAEKALSDYADYMREIKKRVHVIQNVLANFKCGQSVTRYHEIDIELCILQFRKCLELVMFATLVAHYHSGVELQKRLYEREWNATKIMAYLKRENPKFYPNAVNRIFGEEGQPANMAKVDGALTQKEFGELYDQFCGKHLHASRNRSALGDLGLRFSEIEDWLEKFVKLLNSHWIDVRDDLAFAVLMQTGFDKDVQVVVFKSIGPG